VTLLEGVTGSGKTEVYFEAIAEALRAGQAGSGAAAGDRADGRQFLDRFHQRFGAPPAEWHSDLAPKMRERVWRQVTDGRVQVVAGARSALFLPFADLGLIIVDEEHDPPTSRRTGCSTMPATWRWCGPISAGISGRAGVCNTVDRKPGQRRSRAATATCVLPGAMPMPGCRTSKLVDMQAHPPARGGFLSPLLAEGHGRDARAQGAVALVSQPARLCAADAVPGLRPPVRVSGLLELAGRAPVPRPAAVPPLRPQRAVPQACPECGALDHLVACGPGIERIAEEADKHFPDARVIVLSSDMAGGTKRLGSSSRRSQRARPISSSARSWWPRGTISR
jgi:primosomal protein N' (replication factor Y)